MQPILNSLINVLHATTGCGLSPCQSGAVSDSTEAQNVLGMGTKVIGVTTDSEAALTLAQEFFPYDPTLIKKYEPSFDAQETSLTCEASVGTSLSSRYSLPLMAHLSRSIFWSSQR